MFDDDERTWLLDTCDVVIRQEIAVGFNALPAAYRLLNCLWIADYGMTNAGDLQACYDIRMTFLEDGQRSARELELPVSVAAFSLNPEEFQRRYFEFFGNVVREIKSLFEDEGKQP